ncbi:unnamed protein product, partial [Didymodactylos carnosus]
YGTSAIGKSVVVNVPVEHWKLLADSKPRPTQSVQLIFVMKSHDSQVADLERKFEQVSDPTHADYGKFLSYDEIHQQLLNETTKSGAIVEKWLQQHDGLNIRSTAHKEFLIVQLPLRILRLIEQLFQTNLNTYQHRLSGQLTFKARQFQLSSIISDHIDHIEGLSGFPIVLTRSTAIHQLADENQSNAPGIVSFKKSGKKIEFYIQLKCSNGEYASGSICSEFRGYQITLEGLSSTEKQLVSSKNASCQVCNQATEISIWDICTKNIMDLSRVVCHFVLAYDSDKYQQSKVSVQTQFVKNGKTSYSSSAIKKFEQVSNVSPALLASFYNVNMSTIKEKRHIKSRQAVVGFSEYYNLKSFKAFTQSFGKDFNLKIGKVYGVDYKNASYDEMETSLDMEYMAAMGAGIVTDYIQTPNVGFAPFFAELATLESNKSNVVPLVYSISYGGNARLFERKVIRMYDVQFMKMGVSGKTIFVSSGDDGISSEVGVCPKPFLPLYPASSPYVTSVGATQLVRGVNGSCRYIPQGSGICLGEIVAYTNDLTGCSITSGGGFSEYQSMPSWQKTFVQNYLASASKRLPASTYFNKSNRAYPDITLLGHAYSIKVQGNFNNLVDGTSASSPTTAGLFSLINDQRLKLDMKPLGFLNPLLYQLARTYPEVFYDIVTGKNNCQSGSVCCQYGFEAQKGYDPVSGLGSINHGLMMKLLTQKTTG